MISENELDKVREKFRLAATDFGFSFCSPIELGETFSAFGYIEKYGSKNGVVISLFSDSDYLVDKEVKAWCKKNGVFYSCINIQPLLGEYKPSYFREMLRDWGKFE